VTRRPCPESRRALHARAHKDLLCRRIDRSADLAKDAEDVRCSPPLTGQAVCESEDLNGLHVDPCTRAGDADEVASVGSAPGHPSSHLVAFHDGVLDDARQVGERVVHHAHPVLDSGTPRSLSRHGIVVHDVFGDEVIQRVLVGGSDRSDDGVIGLSKTPLSHAHMVPTRAYCPPALPGVGEGYPIQGLMLVSCLMVACACHRSGLWPVVLVYRPLHRDRAR
jgi:hypothetical protein